MIVMMVNEPTPRNAFCKRPELIRDGAPEISFIIIFLLLLLLLFLIHVMCYYVRALLAFSVDRVLDLR